MEIVPVHHRRDLVSGGEQFPAKLQLGLVVVDPPGHVVHRAHAHDAAGRGRLAKQVDIGTRAPGPGFIAKAAVCVLHRLVTQGGGHQTGGSLVGRQGKGDAVKPTDGMIGRNAAVLPSRAALGRRTHQFQEQAVRIIKREHRFRKPFGNTPDLYPVRFQARLPEGQRTFGYGKGDDAQLTIADPAAHPGRAPGEKGHDTAGIAGIIAIVKMIGERIVKIDGLFDHAQPENAGIKIDILLGIAGHGSDVMDAVDFGGHDVCAPCYG